MEDLDASGAVNLNIFNEYHRKSRTFAGATVGVDMEINEIGIFYMEENMSTPYRWEIRFPEGTSEDYTSHVYEVVSSEYRQKPTLPGMTGSGGIRIFALRGRKPDEVTLSEERHE